MDDPKGQLLHAVHKGDWQSRLIGTAQVLIGGVAVLGIAAWVTLNPTLLLTFLFLQPVLVVGIVLFVVVAVAGRKSVLVECYPAGAVVHGEGAASPFVYVVRSGRLHVVRALDGGREEVVARFEAGDHFGGDAVAAGEAAAVAIRAATPVELLRVNPSDLATLFASVPELRDAMRIVVRDRLPDIASDSRKAG
jgi:Cyclic nucleotide-binding domain